MAIRIERNEEGNCINFHGSSNPTYWNACLSGEVDTTETDTVNVVNDIITAATGVKEYEFFQIPYTEFVSADGNAFASAQAAADYITANANVVGLGGGGTQLNNLTVCFKLDDTSTSIMLDNGYSYGVNTIKALNTGDGLITINSKLGDITHFTGLDHTRVCDGEGNAITGGLNDVINWLNELFTVGAFEQVVIADPYSTMVADIDGLVDSGSLVGTGAVDPIGNDIGSNSTTHNNNAGYLSSETIDQAGEYFTFDIRGEGQIGFGLVHTQQSYDDGHYSGSASYADPTTFCNGVNSSHYGYQFAHFFHPTPNGSWTNYGANTSYSIRPGWSNFNGTDEQADWIAGNPIKMRVGIDTNGYISIETQRGSSWEVHARTSYTVAEGAEFKLGIKFSNPSVRLYTTPKVHLLEPEAPTMYFRWIESPDGTFVYPLFATAEEAEYYDEITNGLTAGTGSSHTHTYADDPTGTTWYMPEATHDAAEYHHTSAPAGTETFDGNTINWTTITSLTNADLTPAQFTSADITQEEGTNINMQLMPADATFSQSVTISPSGSGLVYNTSTHFLQGTLADVGADTTYTITVTRANSYGSSVGSFTITATDVAPVQTNTTAWTRAVDFSGSSERLTSPYANNAVLPIRMNGDSSTVAAPSTTGYTSAASLSKPWATAIVFKYDGNNSNQHIWNQGEGAGSTDDNIYLRVSNNGDFYFGWGRQGALNECKLGNWGGTSNLQHWHSFYIAHNGTRLSGSNATAANLAAAFDIRYMGSNDTTPWGGVYQLSTVSNWTNGTTGGRMDRSVEGYFTVGGRGTNRSFHGKVASMVVTTLQRNVAMPAEAEIREMITDPVGWLNDYKVGNSYRVSQAGSNNSNFQLNDTNSAYATQVWLMGDGTNDAFSEIRNQVHATESVYTKMNMASMVSNDIETVNINGLT
jgi:hypothetical protein